ncbi:MAG: hypothetical protein L0I62_05585 [Gammaproteobacteria bacterium]|nr:hypothetical protein [Gammaproteobacteria bacterium]
MKTAYTGPLIAVAVLIAVIIVLALAAYTVRPGEAALELHNGKVTAVNSSAGLHWKLPLFQSLVRLDTRARVSRGRVWLHEDRKSGLAADYAVVWRITDPRRYYEATGGDVSVLNQRMKKALEPVLRKAMSAGSARDFLSGPSEKLGADMTEAIRDVAAGTGVTVLEATPTTANVPKQLADKVSATMAAAVQTRVAAARKSAKAERAVILGEATAKSARLVADAKQEAARITGKSQARVAGIYGPVARKAPEFFDYYLELQSKADALKSNTRILVLSMDSPWFKALDDMAKSSKDSQ